MQSLIAEFSADVPMQDKRRAVRRKLRLDSKVSIAKSTTRVVVLDLSARGMMIHTETELAVGEAFEVDLPLAGAFEACVIWRRMTLYGCEFRSPIPGAAISAALLKARHD